MNSIVGILLSVELWKFLLPVLGGVATWVANEWRKRRAAAYERKEERYKGLLQSLHGFYAENPDVNEVRAEFVSELNIAWLYCPDHVIRKGYDLLDAVQADSAASQQQKRRALGTFLLAVREDLLSRRLVRHTNLQPGDCRDAGLKSAP